jgi:hypothetical protein
LEVSAAARRTRERPNHIRVHHSTDHWTSSSDAIILFLDGLPLERQPRTNRQPRTATENGKRTANRRRTHARLNSPHHYIEYQHPRTGIKVHDVRQTFDQLTQPEQNFVHVLPHRF